jgi:mRNA interferase MazF
MGSDFVRLVARMTLPRRGEIWMTDLNPVVGHEQGGIRPALVVSVDEFNHGPAALVSLLPITSTRRDLASRVRLPAGEGGLTMESYIKCEEIRTVSRDRLIRRTGTPDAKYLLQAMTQVRYFLGL